MKHFRKILTTLFFMACFTGLLFSARIMVKATPRGSGYQRPKGPVESYGLYVGDTLVTSLNRNDIPGILGGGKKRGMFNLLFAIIFQKSPILAILPIASDWS